MISKTAIFILLVLGALGLLFTGVVFGVAINLAFNASLALGLGTLAITGITIVVAGALAGSKRLAWLGLGAVAVGTAVVWCYLHLQISIASVF